MRIISKNKIVEYCEQNATAKVALEEWYTKAKKAEWSCFADVKKSFNHVDSVGNQHYVFDIKGNDFRLVVVIKFAIGTILIRFIGTHAKYDKIENISNI